jgi:predicted ArsR family transcriptional regulator
VAFTAWHQRLLQSTRGRLLGLLQRDARTVEELARDLELTDNAIRTHLAALERDGLVRQQGVRRGPGSGKPAYLYEVTEEAESLFPKAYALVLGYLLDTLGDHVVPQQVRTLLREAGRRVAAERPVPHDAIDAFPMRLDGAVQLLNDLGGLAEVEEHEGTLAIQCYSCPLARVVTRHPDLCTLTESLLTTLVGRPVQQRCARADRPRCRFDVTPQ